MEENLSIKVLWLARQEKGYVPYSPEHHQQEATKFLYYKDINGEPLLLVGNHDFHGLLATHAREEGLSLPEIPDGGGDIYSGGLESWCCGVYFLLTPKKFRPLITSALGGIKYNYANL